MKKTNDIEKGGNEKSMGENERKALQEGLRKLELRSREMEQPEEELIEELG